MKIIALDIAILPTKFTNCIKNCIYCTIYNFYGYYHCSNLVSVILTILEVHFMYPHIFYIVHFAIFCSGDLL